MNLKEKQEQINYIGKNLKMGELKHLNCIRLNPTCSEKHNRAIIDRCMEYIKTGVLFLTEATFVTGGRCDILLLSTTPPLIEEILVSESDERFEAKSYPFRTVKIRVK